MKRLIPLLLLCSCSRAITGTATEISGQNVTVRVVTVTTYRFKLDSTAVTPLIGDTVNFKVTVNRKKINSKRL